MVVDTLLAKRVAEGKPIQVALSGAGWSARRVVHQLHHGPSGARVAVICARDPGQAREAWAFAGVDDAVTVDNPEMLERCIAAGQAAITDDPALACAANGIEVVIENTGSVDFGAEVALAALAARRHLVLINVELDATLGPALQARAAAAGVVYTNTGGDEPGAAMDLVRIVRGAGLDVVAAGNIKGFLDHHRNPETQHAVALRLGQRPTSMAHFADGTKLALELNVLANAAGLSVSRRGMLGPRLGHVTEAANWFAKALDPEAPPVADYVVDTPPHSGVFVLGRTQDAVRRDYLAYLKMGDGPLYCFYRPFHLPHLELLWTIGRAVLLDDATVAPAGAPCCTTVAVAKRDLPAGAVLDGFGGFNSYGLLDDAGRAAADGLLPVGLAAGCRLTRAVRADEPIRRDTAEAAGATLAARLYDEEVLP